MTAFAIWTWSLICTRRNWY